MGKRIFLFIVTNLAIVFTLSIVAAVLGVGSGFGPEGLNLQTLAVFCLFWGMGGAFISLQMSRFIAKRATGVHLVDGRTGNSQADWLYETVGRLTRQANLPMPEVGIYESPEVNAFATGPSKSRSLVAVSSGLLRGMRPEEVEGVLAHEVAHISNGDMVTMTLLQGVMNAFVMFFARVIGYALTRSGDSRNNNGSYFLVVLVLQIVLGILGSLIVNAFSRHREFRADHGGATLAGREKMVGALRRLAANSEMVDTQHQALATMTLLQGVMNAFVMFFARVIGYALTRSSDSRNSGGSYFLVVLVLQIVLGILGSLVVNAFSRHREFRADHGGATLAGREKMVGALRRLAANSEMVDTQHQALATMKINGGGRGWAALFSTHPPIAERIAALENFR